MTVGLPTSVDLNVSPGSVVRVRNEDWVITSASATTSGTLIKVQGLSELVRDTEAAFYSDLDRIDVVDPRNAKIVADPTAHYRLTRLFLETTLRKTPVPSISPELTVSTRMLADALGYQRTAVAKALDPSNIRPRILIADAVGLGKTLEIGMILSELVVRGRGENILIVTPRHVLEQMQHEMWTRFALPFVRLDSVGIQRVRQTIPASRNPFTYFKRAIISIDTLKTPRYRAHLEKRRWDAVVIDESHNLTNTGTLNNELARLLAPRTDALILASATPHNGKKESFAELVRLLDPTAVHPNGDIDRDAVKKLVIRRHRYSPEVAREVGADWAERAEPQNRLIPASTAEDAIATELSETWLHNPHGSPGTNGLFGWTLAKAFLSSPAALAETIRERLQPAKNAGPAEVEALRRLQLLAEEAQQNPSAKFTALVNHLKDIGVGKGNSTRAVVFAERVATLKFLHAALPEALGLKPANIGLLHGGLSDVEQQDTVEDFKRGNSELRVLVTGDVASEGVNLHAQCHHLVHYDIPWSLIRIEQRNGRIDRYGQKHTPQITTLLLEPTDERFSGDVRVFTRLVEKEHEAHRALDDVAVLMGRHSVEAEEKAIRDMLAYGQDLEEVVPDEPQWAPDSLEALLAGLEGDEPKSPPDDGGPGSAPRSGSQPVHEAGGDGTTSAVRVADSWGLYDSQLDYLDDALQEAFGDPERTVKWSVDSTYHVASLEPPKDLRKRLRFLPQDYLSERKVTEQLLLATSRAVGQQSLDHARASEDTNWPAAHYLGPLHPVLDWAGDRALASMSRNEVPAIRGDVDESTFLLLGTITNRRGQVLNRTFMSVSAGFATPISSVAEFFEEIGLDGKAPNPGPVPVAGLQDRLPAAVDTATAHLSMVRSALTERASDQLEEWMARAEQWTHESDALIQRAEVRQRTDRVKEERRLAQDLSPDQELVRPLLAVVPRTTRTADQKENR
ncbi:helicase-related protein [Micrococcus sp. IITD107]|uniref:helicase-related protein n=1 Tax=Micrococcus sp. IITD107 TaxID=3342790 RepID=UPI0035B8AC7B